MFNFLKRKLNSPSPCYKCNHKYFYTKIIDTIDGYSVSEYEERCKLCHTPCHFWAYGHYQDPYTRKELINYIWTCKGTWIRKLRTTLSLIFN